MRVGSRLTLLTNNRFPDLHANCRFTVVHENITLMQEVSTILNEANQWLRPIFVTQSYKPISRLVWFFHMFWSSLQYFGRSSKFTKFASILYAKIKQSLEIQGCQFVTDKAQNKFHSTALLKVLKHFHTYEKTWSICTAYQELKLN